MCRIRVTSIDRRGDAREASLTRVWVGMGIPLSRFAARSSALTRCCEESRLSFADRIAISE